MSLKPAKPEHEVFYQDLIKLLNKHGNKIDGLEMLAIASNMLGKIIALQDHRTVTHEMVMEIVTKNVQNGNNEVLAEVAKDVLGQ